jgi:serine/threonine protein kinase
MKSQNEFSSKKITDKYNQLLLEFHEKFNNGTQNQTEENYALLIKNAGKYFAYVDISSDFLGCLLDITYLIYDENQRVCNEKFKGVKLSENVKEQILSHKRKISPKVEEFRDELERVDSELFKNIFPSFWSKCVELNYSEIPRSELISKLFQAIQEENESTYYKLKDWQENKGIKEWINNLIPSTLNDRGLQQLFNYKTKNGKSSTDDSILNSYKKIKESPFGFDRKKLVIKNLSVYNNINTFYKKLVPVYLLDLAKELDVATQENPILILERIVREFAKTNNHNIDEIGLFTIYEMMLAIDKKSLREFKLKDFINITSIDSNKTETDKDTVKKFKPYVSNFQNIISSGLSRYERNYHLFVLSAIEAKNDDSLSEKDKQHLNYIGQLYAFDINRAEGKCIPTSIDFFDDQLGLTSELKILFGQTSWGKCIDLVYSELLDTNIGIKAQKSFLLLFDELLESYSTSKTLFLEKLRSTIKSELYEEGSTEEQEIIYRRGIYIEELLGLTQSYSQFNDKKSVIEELTARVLLRLISLFLQSGKIKAYSPDLIHNALKFEVACLSQEYFSGCFINQAIADKEHEDLNSLVPNLWQKYQKESISAFKVWLIFLIEKKALKTTNTTFINDVKQAFSKYINHKTRPSSATSLVIEHDPGDSADDEVSDKSKRDTLVPIAEYNLKEDDINHAALLIYTNKYKYKKEESSAEARLKCQFVLFQPQDILISDGLKAANQILNEANIDVDQFNDSVNENSLIKQWDQEFSIESNEVLTYSYFKYLLVDSFGKKFAKTKSIETNKPNFKNIIVSKNSASHFKKFNSNDCVKLTFNYSDDIFKEKLEQKNTLLSTIYHFGHDRFIIKTKNDKAEALGQGAFGVVYHAMDTLLNSEVAIKLIPHWFRAKDVSNTLINEAASMRHCQHPNVTVVYDLIKLNPHNCKYQDEREQPSREVFDDNEFVYGVVMEYVDGVTLNKFIDDKYSFNKNEWDFKQKLDLFIDICEGVNKIHALGMVHGDLKPENILVMDTDDNLPVVKITDFGLSSKVGQASPSTNNKFSSINLLEGGKLTEHDDIHSLGMIFVYLFSPRIIDCFENEDIVNLVSTKNCFYLTLLSLRVNFRREINNDFEHIGRIVREDSKGFLIAEEILKKDPIEAFTNFREQLRPLILESSYGLESDHRILTFLAEILFPQAFYTDEQLYSSLRNIIGERVHEPEYVELQVDMHKHMNKISATDINSIINSLYILKAGGNTRWKDSFEVISTPRVNGQVFTLADTYKLPLLEFSSLIRIANNSSQEISFLFEFIDDSKHYTLIWRIGEELYRIYAVSNERFYKHHLVAEIFNKLEQTYGNYFELIGDVINFNDELSQCLSIFRDIPPSKRYYNISLDRSLEGASGYYEYSLSENLLLLIGEVQSEINNAYLIYEEINKLLYPSHSNEGLIDSRAIDVFFQFVKRTIPSNIMNTMNVKLMGSIKEYILTNALKDFNCFYCECFGLDNLKKMLIKWEGIESDCSIDDYVELKRWSEESKEYFLLKQYAEQEKYENLEIVSS